MASSYRMQCWHPANPVEQTLAWFSNPKATRTRLRHRLSAEQTGRPRRLLLAQRFGAAAAAFGRIELSGTAAFERSVTHRLAIGAHANFRQRIDRR